MCFTATSLKQMHLKYAKRRSDNPAYIEQIEDEIGRLEQEELQGHFVANAYAHPKLLTFTNEAPLKPQAFTWGLIPGWVKDKKQAFDLWNKTANARGETIFEKPSFRHAAKHQRCLIYLDSFFEYYHAHDKAYPFRILLKKEEIMIVAGLWEEWVDKETGEVWKTVTIVTTNANPLLSKIHNNPKQKSPRMPVLLHPEDQDKWLNPDDSDIKKSIKKLIRPYDNDEMDAYTVPRLTGKKGVGDSPKALKKFTYEELVADQGELF